MIPFQVVFCSRGCAESENAQVHRRMCGFWESMPYDEKGDMERERSDFGRGIYMGVRAILSVPPEQWLAVFDKLDPGCSGGIVEPCKLPADLLPPRFRAALSMPSMAFNDMNHELMAIHASNGARVVTWLDKWAFPDDRKMQPHLKCFLAALFATNMTAFTYNETEVADSE
jgi:hypothetical protein